MRTAGSAMTDPGVPVWLPIALGVGAVVAWRLGRVLVAVALAAAITSRRRVDSPIKWAVFVVICAVVFSGACNLVAVLHRPTTPGDARPIVGDPGVWVGLMAVWPVLAFGLVAGLKATKPAHAEADETPAEGDVPPRTSPVRGAAARPSYAGAELADSITEPKGYGRLRDGGTAPDGGHTPAATADFPAVEAGANGASDHVAVVVPVAAAWTRTGLSAGDDDPAEHNGQHTDGHTRRPLPTPADIGPAPAPAPAPMPVPPPRQPLTGPTPTPAAPPPALPQTSAETTGPRLPAVQFHAPELPAPAAEAATTPGGEADVADLLGDGRKVRDELAAAGRPLTRSTLHAGLKERGQRAGTRKLDALLRELRAEPVGAGR
ncbi:hypothetical protein FsymDg_0947 [Candidatus Protofrankia datiscae]|uniref:Uncharacterized protein n=2 Tax=Frankiaceae TaxID=74712 RepID=F8AXA1_9ACTN|nr:hypothetical protein FsymDg_0947 [Candidatus Protofrankia datiscae]